MKLEDRIAIYYTALTKTEREVYRAVMAQPTLFLNESIQKSAKTVGVSVASIQRFVKKIGYAGYPAFKLDLANFVSQPLNPSKEEQTRLQRIMSGYIKTFEVIAKLDLERTLINLVADLQQFELIKSVGIGNSGLSAEQLVYSMYSEDYFIEPVTDKIRVDYLTNALTSDYLLIVFSVTGSTTTYQNLFETAKKKHAKTYLITMNQETSLLSLADQSIVLPSTHISDRDHTLFQIDNRTILYNFAEVVSYYYATQTK